MKKIIPICSIVILIFSIIIINSLKSPFSKMQILNQDIRIKKYKEDYNISIDCSKIKDNNEQIINYELINKYKDSKINIKTDLYNNKAEQITDLENVNNMIVKIEIEDKNYRINATCK